MPVKPAAPPRGSANRAGRGAVGRPGMASAGGGELPADEALIDEVHRLRVLVEVADTVTQRLALDHQLPRLIDLIAEAFEADRAALFLYDRDSGELLSRVLRGEGVAEIRIPAAAGIAGAVFTSGVAEIIPDVYQDARFHTGTDKQTGYRTRNMLCLPLRNRDGQVI